MTNTQNLTKFYSTYQFH